MKKGIFSVSALFLFTVFFISCQRNNPTDPISAPPTTTLENGQAPFAIQPATAQAPGDSFVFFPGPVGIGTSDAGNYKLFVAGGEKNGIYVSSDGTYGIYGMGGSYGGNFRGTATGGVGVYGLGDGYGGYFNTSGPKGIGVSAIGQQCGIYAASPNCAGRFDGNVKVKGSITADSLVVGGISLSKLVEELTFLKEENKTLKARISALENSTPKSLASQ